MNARRTAEGLFVLNYVLLATHEIDSAYWHEWTLFGIPGGIQLFLVLNVVLLLVFLIGLVRFVREPRKAAVYSLALSATGILAFLLHGAFLLLGHPEFRLPASVALLGLILVVSLAQGWYTLGILRDNAPRSRTPS